MWTFLPPKLGTRKLVTFTTFLFIYPLVGWAMAVQNPDTPFYALLDRSLVSECRIRMGAVRGNWCRCRFTSHNFYHLRRWMTFRASSGRRCYWMDISNCGLLSIWIWSYSCHYRPELFFKMGGFFGLIAAVIAWWQYARPNVAMPS